MAINRKLKRILNITGWLTAGSILFVLFIAAMGKRYDQRCTKIEVEIEGETNTLFIDRNEVINILTANGGRKVKGEKIGLLPLKEMEKALETNVWISNAELFFDKDGVLEVRIRENVPVARVFSITGASWYIDSTGTQLPLSDKYSARLPVFTGFPTNRKAVTKQDSLVFLRTKEIAMFLHENPVWMAQVSQVDITPQKNFELVPVIGNYIVELGDGSALPEKFGRLELFCKQIIPATGPQAWSRLKVQFNNQVVAVRRNASRLNIPTITEWKDTLSMRLTARDTAQAVAVQAAGLSKRINNKHNNPVKPTAGKTPKAVMPTGKKHNNN